MIKEFKCEEELRELLRGDRAAFIREYRNAMQLHGDATESENIPEEEMIRALCRDESPEAHFQKRREQWGKTL